MLSAHLRISFEIWSRPVALFLASFLCVLRFRVVRLGLPLGDLLFGWLVDFLRSSFYMRRRDLDFG